MRALPSQAGFCLTSSGMFPSGALCYRVYTAPTAHGAASQDHSVSLIHFVLLKAKPHSGEGGNLNPFIVRQGGGSSRSPNPGKAGLARSGKRGDSREVRAHLGVQPSFWNQVFLLQSVAAASPSTWPASKV